MWSPMGGRHKGNEHNDGLGGPDSSAVQQSVSLIIVVLSEFFNNRGKEGYGYSMCPPLMSFRWVQETSQIPIRNCNSSPTYELTVMLSAHNQACSPLSSNVWLPLVALCVPGSWWCVTECGNRDHAIYQSICNLAHDDKPHSTIRSE